MELRHLKNSELDAKFQKLQRTCGPEGVVRDDSGNYAVFTKARFLHHIRRQQQSHTLFQDCPEAQNKRATLRVRTRKKRKTLLICCDSLKKIARLLEYC